MERIDEIGDLDSVLIVHRVCYVYDFPVHDFRVTMNIRYIRGHLAWCGGQGKLDFGRQYVHDIFLLVIIL